jgi:hypothetical protein
MPPRILTHRSILLAGLVALALLWLVLLQITRFNVVTVALGLLVALAVMT